MNEALIVSKSLFASIIASPRDYCGKIFDITNIQDDFDISLDLNQIANHDIFEEFNITKDDLLKEVVERKIRYFAKKAGIPVISLDKENSQLNANLLNLLKKDSILLLK